MRRLLTKQQGMVGHLLVAAYLTELGWHIFTELGDSSRIDLIAVKSNFDPITIQVKVRSAKNGVVNVETKKSGPNYSYNYKTSDCDVFAVVIKETREIFFVSTEEILKRKSSMSFRIVESKNHQKVGVNLVQDYLNFPPGSSETIRQDP